MIASSPVRPEISLKRSAFPVLVAAFALSALTAVAWFFVPAFIIRPFSFQSPRGLLLAMTLHQHAPWVTLAAALASGLLARAMWRQLNWWRRALVAAALLFVSFSTVMARLNYFEWMFHPIAGAQFLAQSKSKLNGTEMVMAVRIGPDARAYPISQMAYHHVLNDVVADEPIVVTY